jgi:D-alanyl-D-alanine carboxypeptidase
MSARVRDLGMKNTVFKNASGLPNRAQRTTSRDMAVLSEALIENHSRRYAYFSYDQFSYRGQTIQSHNRLMRRFAGMDGIKTGFVNASGFNLAASAVRDGRRVIVVVLGGTTAKGRDARVELLLNKYLGGEAGKRVAASRTAEVSGSMPEPALVPALAQLDTDASGPAPIPSSLTEVSTAAVAAPTAPAAASRNVPVSAIVAKPAAKAPASAGRYAAQVGTYKSTKMARAGLEHAADKLGGQPAGTITEVVRNKRGFFLARLSGLSENTAGTVCRKLIAKGQDCAVVER